jgi:3-methyladenine DNA glycosylase AlkD
MILKEALTRLQSLGNDKVRALNIRNGAGDQQFGVKLGDIRKLAAEIKTGHALALDLWATGNLDARLLAVLLLKPDQLAAEELEQMVRSAPVAQVSDWLNSYVLKKHPAKESLRQKWMTAEEPWLARAGWSLTADLVPKTPEKLDLSGLLDRIESELGTAAPAVQWTMNFCLAAIGIHSSAHRARAIAIGEKLGIYRDFPVSKGCTSPFAPVWIDEMVRRQG